MSSINVMRARWVVWGAATATAMGVLIAPTAAAGATDRSAITSDAVTAESVDCAQLALGGYCSLSYADYPDLTSVTIPDGVDAITVILSGASGGGGGTQAGGGQGGSVIAYIPVLDGAERVLNVQLGQRGISQSGGGNGWSSGGRGGSGMDGNNGAAGGGSSSLIYRSFGQDVATLIAGGGGGGGHESLPGAKDGGAGGAGGNPAGDGSNGTSTGEWGAGGEGADSGSVNGGDGGGGGAADEVTAGGGGGGGGASQGGAGGGPGVFNYHYSAPASGGGGGGGDSLIFGAIVSPLAYTAAAFGDGSLTIFAGSPQRYSCIDSHAPRTISVPDDVASYAFVAVGGAGTRGHDNAPQGTGALTSGMLDVEGINKLFYWVGCNGYDYNGAGYGVPGDGGDGGTGGFDGGDGGGMTLIGSYIPGFTTLIAAGGGGGSGGDIANCHSYPGSQCGGQGGSGGGVDGTRYWYNGQEGGGGGGRGGLANANTGQYGPVPHDGTDGTSGGAFTGGGGGGGAGYPRGGYGGHHDSLHPGGGGGAGGSYLSSQRVTGGSISASGSLDSGYILLMPITRTTTTLTVTKAVSGAAESFAHGPFTMDVECTWNGQTILGQTITLAPGGSHEFEGIDQGATCSVDETGTGSATAPAPSRSVTIGSSPATVTMTNEFAVTSFTVDLLSTVRDESGGTDPDVAIPLGDLGVHVECSFNGQQIALPAPVGGGQLDYVGQDTWASGGQSVAVEGVPVGALCRVQLAAGSGATTTEYSGDGISVADGWASFTLGVDETTVRITDVYQLAPISVGKSVDGDSAPPVDAVFPGAVDCTFQGRDVTLPASASFSLAVGATETVHNLPVGAQCTVTETDAGSASATTYGPARTVTVTSEQVPTVTVTNTFDSGSLLVSAATSGQGAAWANAPYSVQVTCTLGGVGVLNTTFSTADATGGWESFEVAADAVCTATETATGGADSVRYASSADATPQDSPVEVTVSAAGTATLTIDNVFTAAPLAVVTSTTGAGAEYASGSTTVTVSDCTFNGLPIHVLPGKASAALTLPAHGGVARIPELVTDASCEVTESDAAGTTATTATAANADPTSSTSDVGVRVTINQPEGNTSTSVAFDNQFDLAALSLSNWVTGAAAWAQNTPYEVYVKCTFLGAPVARLGPNGTAMLQFAADGSAIPNAGSDALTTLSVGSECYAIESVTGGATTVAYEPSSNSDAESGTVIVGPDGSAITITNTFAATTLTTSHVLDGNDSAAHGADVFHFDRACTFNGKRLPAPPSDPEYSEVFTLAGGQSRLDPVLPVGAVCSVSQFDTHDATQVLPSSSQTVTLTADPAALTFRNVFDVTSLSIKEMLVGDGADTFGGGQVFTARVTCVRPNQFNGRVDLPHGGVVELSAVNDYVATLQAPVGIECTAGQKLQMATRQVVSPPVTLRTGTPHVLTITSEYLVAPITVSKTALGTRVTEQMFEFETRCTWSSIDGNTVDVPLNADAPDSFDLRSGQQRTVHALQGSECAVSETGTAGALRVVIAAQGIDVVVTGRTADFRVASEPTTVAFTNFMPGSLPLTGAEIFGTLMTAIALLLVGAGAVIFGRRRRQAQL